MELVKMSCPENMKRSLINYLGIQQPIDGYTEEEKVLEKLLVETTVHSMYAKLPTNRMKFIVAAHFELGYPQELLSDMLGISQERIVVEIGNIRKILLGKPFKPYKQKGKISVDQLLELCMMLKEA